jgi:damage-control phosphatase, subfamily I
MKAHLDCYPCFIRQALMTARLIYADEASIKRVVDAVCRKLVTLPWDVPPPEISRDLYRTIRRISGSSDPYLEIKKRSIAQALRLLPRLRGLVEASPNPLVAAARISVAGNVIDFGVDGEFDLEKEVEAVLSRPFGIDDSGELPGAAKAARMILFVGDNSGESVFDRLLIERLGRPVVYAVREGPIINDATREEAVLSGLADVAEIISCGSDAPGAILGRASKEFLRAYLEADLIISKGQGNYECLSEEQRPLFFLLKAKCGVIARDLGVGLGDFVIARK